MYLSIDCDYFRIRVINRVAGLVIAGVLCDARTGVEISKCFCLSAFPIEPSKLIPKGSHTVYTLAVRPMYECGLPRSGIQRLSIKNVPFIQVPPK